MTAEEIGEWFQDLEEDLLARAQQIGRKAWAYA